MNYSNHYIKFPLHQFIKYIFKKIKNIKTFLFIIIINKKIVYYFNRSQFFTLELIF